MKSRLGVSITLAALLVGCASNASCGPNEVSRSVPDGDHECVSVYDEDGLRGFRPSAPTSSGDATAVVLAVVVFILLGGFGYLLNRKEKVDVSPAAAPESPLEQRFLELLKRLGFEDPVLQHRVRVSGHEYRIDFAYPSHHLAIETDGIEFHKGREAHDQERDQLLAAAGWRTVRFGWDEVVRQPDQVVTKLRNQGLFPSVHGGRSDQGATRSTLATVPEVIPSDFRDGCEIHGQTHDGVALRWGQVRPETEASICVCCFGPCRINATLCTHCIHL